MRIEFVPLTSDGSRFDEERGGRRARILNRMLRIAEYSPPSIVYRWLFENGRRARPESLQRARSDHDRAVEPRR
jgi:hypothetical protein